MIHLVSEQNSSSLFDILVYSSPTTCPLYCVDNGYSLSHSFVKFFILMLFQQYSQRRSSEREG